MKLGAGFGRGLQQGQQFAMGLNQAYQQGQQMREKKEIAQVLQAQPESSTGYTADNGQQLEKLANDGYAVDFDQSKNAYTATKEGAEPVVVPMQGVTDLLGERTAGTMSKDQVDMARMSAVADVISKRDPARGMQMKMQARRDAHDTQRMGREEKQWGREDGIEALDKELGTQFEASLTGEDGQRRAPTADDYLQNNQQRAFKLAQAGYRKEAEHAFKENLSTAHIKIQLDGAQRKQALGPAMAALASGDYGAVAEFYNKYVPSGSKVTGISAGKDGGLVMERTGVDGQVLPALRAKDQREAMAMLQSLENPGALYQYSQDEFRNQLSLKADARADRAEGRAARAEGRSAATHNASMQDRKERRSITEALAKEMEPDASPAKLAAYGAGVLSLKPQGSDKYDYDPVKTQKEFGEVEANPITGKETVKRNAAKEAEFKQWWGENPNIRSQDEALVRFNQSRAKAGKHSKAAAADEDAKHAETVKQVRKAITPEALAATAKKRGMSVDEVRAELAKRGIVE
jgi:hypothetical protein